MLVRIANDMSDARQTRKFLRGPLGITAGYDDPSLWVFAMDTADRRAGVLIGGSRYGTRVEDHNARLSNVYGTVEALVFQLPFDGCPIGLRGPAAKILYVKAIHSLIVPSD